MPCLQPFPVEVTLAVGLNAMQATSGGLKTGTLSHVSPSAAQTLQAIAHDASSPLRAQTKTRVHASLEVAEIP
jgi:hypothetical protein